MLKRNILFKIAGLLLTLAWTAPLVGQTFEEGYSMGPSARPFEDIEPFDSEHYEYDAQLWAPYDVTRMSGHEPRPVGLYVELGFAYLSVNRPGAADSADPRDFYTGSDWSWARQLGIGYMTSKDAGWAANWTDLEGMTFVNGEDIEVLNPMALVTQFDDVELNRQFRQHLSNGGWIEPYLGLAFRRIHDRTIWDDNPNATRFVQNVGNNGLGAHIGSQYFKDYGRFEMGADAGVGAFYVDQSYHASTFGSGFSPENQQNTLRNSDVAPALDLGLNLRYQVTRDISIRGGVELQYMWEGIARADIRRFTVNPHSGNNPYPTTIQTVDDFVLAGFTFGVDWNR